MRTRATTWPAPKVHLGRGFEPQSCSSTTGSFYLPGSPLLTDATVRLVLLDCETWRRATAFGSRIQISLLAKSPAWVTTHTRQHRPGVSSWDVFPDTVVRQTLRSLKSQSVKRLRAHLWYPTKGLTWKGAELSQLLSAFEALKTQVKVAGVLERLVSVSKFTLLGA